MELKTGRKVLKIQGNVDILRLGKFFSKIYKSRLLSMKNSLHSKKSVVIYFYQIADLQFKKYLILKKFLSF